ncbi:MAG: hypothetical protein AAGK74_13400 [Chloroflexota bacterium]
MQLRGLNPQRYLTVNNDRIDLVIDASNNADFEINVTAATADILRCFLRIKTSPFIATATSAASTTSSSGGGATVSSAAGGGTSTTSAAGGDHSHMMFTYISSTIPPVTGRNYGCKDSTGNPTLLRLITSGTDDLYTQESSGDHTHSITIPAHTHQVIVPDHTHVIPAASLVYGLNRDTSTPISISIFVNGNNETVALGGPWALSGGDNTIEVEISDILKSASTLQQAHTVSIRCAGGQGRVEAQIERYEVIQNIRLAA